MLVGQQSKLNHLFASIWLAAMGAIGDWVAFFAPANGFSGGLPFLSDVQNVVIARAVFGGGAVMTFLCCGYALRLFFSADTSVRKDKGTPG